MYLKHKNILRKNRFFSIESTINTTKILLENSLYTALFITFLISLYPLFLNLSAVLFNSTFIYFGAVWATILLIGAAIHEVLKAIYSNNCYIFSGE